MPFCVVSLFRLTAMLKGRFIALYGMVLLAGTAGAFQYKGTAAATFGGETVRFEAISCTFHGGAQQGFKTFDGRATEENGGFLSVSLVLSENEQTAQAQLPGGRMLVAVYEKTPEGWTSRGKPVDGPLITVGGSTVTATGAFFLNMTQEVSATIEVTCSH